MNKTINGTEWVIASASPEHEPIKWIPDPEVEAEVAIDNILQGNAPWWIMELAQNYPATAIAYAFERRDRARMENWLFTAREEAVNEGRDVDGLDFIIERIQTSDPDRETFVRKGTTSGFALNRWGARPILDDVEYGIIEEVDILEIERDTYLQEQTKLDGVSLRLVTESEYVQNADIDEEPELEVDTFYKEVKVEDPFVLSNIEEFIFESKVEARAFALKCKTDKTFVSAEVRVESGIEKYCVSILKPVLNWDHLNANAAARDAIVEKALELISKATTRKELCTLQKRAIKYSKDNQLLKKKKTFEKKNLTQIKIGIENPTRATIGLDYIRFAKIMNAIHQKAAELKISGFKKYQVNQWKSKTQAQAEKSKDILDRGGQVGEYHALDTIDESADSLWQIYEERQIHKSRYLAPKTTFKLDDSEIEEWINSAPRTESKRRLVA